MATVFYSGRMVQARPIPGNVRAPEATFAEMVNRFDDLLRLLLDDIQRLPAPAWPIVEELLHDAQAAITASDVRGLRRRCTG